MLVVLLQSLWPSGIGRYIKVVGIGLIKFEGLASWIGCRTRMPVSLSVSYITLAWVFRSVKANRIFVWRAITGRRAVHISAAT